jgi:2-dehydro-3-deoxygluconokinase
MAKAAKSSGTLISFDLNHRAAFWSGRERELRDLFTELASLSDILIGNEEDFQLALGLEGPETGGVGLDEKIDGFQAMIARAKDAYPQASVFAATLREVISANRHRWGALLFAENEWHIEPPRDIDILDRIGGGDGFVGGLLYGLLKGMSPAECLAFGWATGALAVSSDTDYASPINEDQVWRIRRGNARVER